MARTAATRASAVFAVGLPSMKGVHALVRVMADLLAFGVPVDRIVPVVNCAPRSPRARAGLTATLAELIAPAVARAAPDSVEAMATPVFLMERKVDGDLHDGARLPTVLGAPLAGAFAAVLDRSSVATRPAEGPERVRPGSLGRWADPEPEVASG